MLNYTTCSYYYLLINILTMNYDYLFHLYDVLHKIMHYTLHKVSLSHVNFVRELDENITYCSNAATWARNMPYNKLHTVVIFCSIN